MRVEQRIGRIDRLGQAYSAIRIVNLHYEGTFETDVYRALRTRINLFEAVVGPLQPILARLPRTIAGAVLSGRGRRGESAGRSVTERVPESDADGRADVVEAIERQVREARASGFDIDATVDTDVTMPSRAPAPIAMQDLDRVIAAPDLMPPGTDIQPLGHREYGLLAPGMAERLRVTTNPTYYEEHSESVELWSPGNPLAARPGGHSEAAAHGGWWRGSGAQPGTCRRAPQPLYRREGPGVAGRREPPLLDGSARGQGVRPGAEPLSAPGR